jgi:hypothetical protein
MVGYLPLYNLKKKKKELLSPKIEKRERHRE